MQLPLTFGLAGSVGPPPAGADEPRLEIVLARLGRAETRATMRGLQSRKLDLLLKSVTPCRIAPRRSEARAAPKGSLPLGSARRWHGSDLCTADPAGVEWERSRMCGFPKAG